MVQPGALDAMAEFLDAHETVWAVGPAIVNPDGSPQRTGVRFPSNWNILAETLFLDRLYPQSRLFGRHKEMFEDPSRPRPVDYVQGACLMVRFKAIETVGPLDERFFMYFEETDWCYRMKAAGGEVYYCPSGTVVHFGGGEIGHYDEHRLLQYHRSLLLFYQKNYSTAQAVAMRAILVVRAVLRTLVWLVLAAVRPTLRRSALSSVRGYVKVLGIMCRPLGQS
jgi:GT2 family glycosyltransferase